MEIVKRLYFLQLAVLILLAVLYLYFALYLRYSWTVWWWDIPLHVLGGMWVALALSLISRFFGYRTSFTRCILFAFVIGVLWEVFEYELGIGGSVFMPYWVDTAKDVFDDCIGGTIAGLLIKSRFV